MVDRAYVGAGGALVGSSWASAGLPGAGLPPASLRDNRCVTAPAPPGRIDPKDLAAEASLRGGGHGAPAPPGRIDLPDILQSQLPPPDKRGRYCRKSEEDLRGPHRPAGHPPEP